MAFSVVDVASVSSQRPVVTLHTTCWFESTFSRLILTHARCFELGVPIFIGARTFDFMVCSQSFLQSEVSPFWISGSCDTGWLLAGVCVCVCECVVAPCLVCLPRAVHIDQALDEGNATSHTAGPCG